jgi:hypothetical protein
LLSPRTLLSHHVDDRAFSCAGWTQEEGPGVLASPRAVVDGSGDDEAQVVILSD